MKFMAEFHLKLVRDACQMARLRGCDEAERALMELHDQFLYDPSPPPTEAA